MIGGISHAVVLMQARDDLDFTPQATVPAASNTPPELLATARDAVRRGQPVVACGRRRPRLKRPARKQRCVSCA